MQAIGTEHAIFPPRRSPQAVVTPGLAIPSWMTRLVEDSRNAPRYCLKYGVVVLALFGLTQVWQAGGDGPISAFQPLDPTAHVDPLHLSAPGCMFTGTDPQTRRAALAPALAILDQVHPDVASWVRDTERRGKVLFADGLRIGSDGSNHLAEYDVLLRTLTIGRGVFAENDGVIATVLCHEYRHSRQRFPKTIVYALSFVVHRHGDPAIIENDARLFEQEAQLAVFGKYQEP